MRFWYALREEERERRSEDGGGGREGGRERGKRKRNSLSPEVASTSGLELDDDFSQLDVSLLLKLCQHSSTKEHL